MRKKALFFQNAVWFNAVSGGDIRLVKLLEFLKKNYEISVVTNERGKAVHLRNGNNFHFYITPSWFDRLGIYISYILRTIYAILVLMKEKNAYDIFYSSSDFFPDVIPCFLFKKKSNEWVQVIHHMYPAPFRRRGRLFRNIIGFVFQRFSFYLIKKRADKIILVNEIMKKNLIKLGFLEKKIFINSNGINYEYFQEIPKIEPSFSCIMLGRFNYSKGVFDLPRIWKFFTSPPTLGIIGEGEEKLKKNFQEILAREHLEDKIKVLGYLDERMAFGLIKSAKVFVFPSHEEGWGIAIAEAMALGVPVVAWNLSVYDYVFRDYILKVPENDYKAFANTISILLNDEKIREDIARRGQEFIKRYSWEEVARMERMIIDG